jgi:hypothetical protein
MKIIIMVLLFCFIGCNSPVIKNEKVDSIELAKK